MAAKLTKINQFYWRVEYPGNKVYASVERKASYDRNKCWKQGWYVIIRDDKSGEIIKTDGTFGDRVIACIAAGRMILDN